MKLKVPITLTFIVCAFASLTLNLVADDSTTLDIGNEDAILKQQLEDSRLNELEAQLHQLEVRLEAMQRRYDETQRRYDALLADDIPPIRFRPIDAFYSSSMPARDSTNKGFIGVQLDQATGVGVPIIRVIEGSPANIALIREGDVITRIGDVEVAKLDNPVESLVELINSNPPGSIIQITLLRNDDEMEVDVATVRGSSIGIEETTHYQLPATLSNIRERVSSLFQPKFERLSNDVYVMDINQDFGRYFDVESGVLVLEAEDIEGIQAGDILLKVDDQPIRTVSQAIEEIQDGDDELTILVKRNKREKRVTVDNDSFKLRNILE